MFTPVRNSTRPTYVENAREDPRKRQPPQVQRDDLKHEEEREDRQQRHGDLTHVFRDGVQVLPAHLDGVFQRGDDRLGRGVRLGLIDRAEQQHRRDRPDRAQRHKTEAVGLGVLVASDGRDAHSERHDERNRHRPGRHAAGVERDGEDRPVREKRAEKHERVEHDQQRPQRDAEQNTRHADHEEQTHADGHREHEGGFVDGGDVRREYLQIRFGDGDGRAEGKAAAPQFVKQYRAVLAGVPDAQLPAAGVLRDYLFKDSRKGRVFPVSRPRKGVREAVLEYRILATAGESSLAEITLHTGRTHQIRVQFASRKHPLYGDGKYGSRQKGSIALQSCGLRFVHPDTGKPMAFSLPLPAAAPWKEFLELGE